MAHAANTNAKASGTAATLTSIMPIGVRPSTRNNAAITPKNAACTLTSSRAGGHGDLERARSADPLHRARINAKLSGNLAYARAARLSQRGANSGFLLGRDSPGGQGVFPHSGRALGRRGLVPGSCCARIRQIRLYGCVRATRSRKRRSQAGHLGGAGSTAIFNSACSTSASTPWKHRRHDFSALILGRLLP
jgi:hypothetical protein